MKRDVPHQPFDRAERVMAVVIGLLLLVDVLGSEWGWFAGSLLLMLGWAGIIVGAKRFSPDARRFSQERLSRRPDDR
jgi:hypothetical protein